MARSEQTKEFSLRSLKVDRHRVTVGIAGPPDGPQRMTRVKVDDKELMASKVSIDYEARNFRKVTIDLFPASVVAVPAEEFDGPAE